MFYCEKCKDRFSWPGVIPLSYGPCEMCGKAARCFDIPSKYLPTPKESDDSTNPA